MYCAKCGTPLRDGAKFCQKCGSPVLDPMSFQNNATPYQAAPARQDAPRVIPQQQIQPQRQMNNQPAYQPQSRPVYAPGTHPYHRLGGFLLFIVVIYYIGGVVNLISAITTVVTYVQILKLSNWLPAGYTACIIFAMVAGVIVNIVAGALAFTFANKIRRKDHGMLRFMQSASIAMMITSVVYYLIIIIWTKQFDYYGIMGAESIIGDLVSMVVPWLIGLIVSTIYFCSSVRVRTYMGSDEYLKRSLFRIGKVSPTPADGSYQPAYNQAPQNVSFDPKTQWICPNCNRINSDYVTTCMCGCPSSEGKKQRPYPEGYDPHNERQPSYNEWKCPECGVIHSNYVGTCSCGYTRH